MPSDWKGYRDSVEGLATFDLLSVERRLKARSRMESRTIVCYLGEVHQSIMERCHGRARGCQIATVTKFRPGVGAGSVSTVLLFSFLLLFSL